MRKPEREHDGPSAKLWAIVVVVGIGMSFLVGCAIGLNQATETKIDEFKAEIHQLNKQLSEYKKEVEILSQSFESIARYLRKFWEELHPEEGK